MPKFIRTWWLRPFVKLDQRHEGMVPQAIVAYRRSPAEYVSSEGQNAGMGMGVTIISRWQYNLLLDLWIVKVSLEWRGGESAKAKEIRAWQAS